MLDSYKETRDLPMSVKTLAASTAAAAFRIVLMPLDALKTLLQVRHGLECNHMWAVARTSMRTAHSTAKEVTGWMSNIWRWN